MVWECALRGKSGQVPIDVIDELDEWVRGEDHMIELRGLSVAEA